MKRTNHLLRFVLTMVSAMLMTVWPQTVCAQKPIRDGLKTAKRIGQAGSKALQGYNVPLPPTPKINPSPAGVNISKDLQKLLPSPELRKQSEEAKRWSERIKRLSEERRKQINILLAPTFYAKAIEALHRNDTTRFASLMSQASEGNYAPAQYAYALTLFNQGRKYEAKALKLVQSAAANKYGPACYLLSACYAHGLYGLKKDSTLSEKWLQKSEKAGSMDAEIVLGLRALERGDSLQAMNHWQRAYRCDMAGKARSKNDSIAYPRYYFELLTTNMQSFLPYMYDQLLQGHLAHAQNQRSHQKCLSLANFIATHYSTPYSHWVTGIYEQGYAGVVPANPTSALRHYQLAADSIPQAKKELADIYLTGNGTAPDTLHAMQLYRQSAEQGCPEAMYMLTCLSVQRGDYGEALKWGTRQEMADSADVQYLMGYTYFAQQDYAKSLAPLRRASAAGYAEAMWLAYAVCTEHLNDSVQGFAFLQQAAETGHADALNDLGTCYLNGEHVERNVAKAIALFEKAKDAGCAEANTNLGLVCYADKKVYGLKPDRQRAADYWRQGTEKGNPNSTYCYALCLLKGHGVKKDKAKAAQLMRQAADAGSEEARDYLATHPEKVR